MTVCFTTHDPVEVQLFATLLRDGGIPTEIINEASYIIGYGPAIGPAALSVPDNYAKQATEILHGRQDIHPLPDDAEFIYDGDCPPSISRLELPINTKFLLGRLFLVFGCVFLFLILIILAYFASILLFI
jgi:hypothetical protein